MTPINQSVVCLKERIKFDLCYDHDVRLRLRNLQAMPLS